MPFTASTWKSEFFLPTWEGKLSAARKLELYPTPSFLISLPIILRVVVPRFSHLNMSRWSSGWSMVGKTLGQWHETKAGGYVAQWRPSSRWFLGHNGYIGQDDPNDETSVRFYTDNYAQLRYFKKDHGLVRSLALAAVADVGYETHRGLPDGVLNGYSLTHRAELGSMWALTFRGDIYYDKTQSVILQLPVASPYSLPNKGAFLGGGFTSTLDFFAEPVARVAARICSSSCEYPVFQRLWWHYRTERRAGHDTDLVHA